MLFSSNITSQIRAIRPLGSRKLDFAKARCLCATISAGLEKESKKKEFV